MITMETETHTITTVGDSCEYSVSFDSTTKGVITTSVKVKLVNNTKETALNEAEELLKKALLICKQNSKPEL